MSAKLIQVIEVVESTGRGVAGDPVRSVRRYYTPEGELLAERDEWAGFGVDIPASPDHARDLDWILAMGHALGMGSGHMVPIVPTVEAFRTFFESIRAAFAFHGRADL